MNKSRKLKLDINYKPIPTNVGDEIYPNGIFNFNISKMLEHITAGKLEAEIELIKVSEWFKRHIRGSVNEEHLPMVDISKPLLQAVSSTSTLRAGSRAGSRTLCFLQ